MHTWLELESRFNTLAPLARYLRIDYQWGAAGEHWSVTGMSQNSVTAQFNGLAQIAGDFLRQVVPNTDQTRPVMDEPHLQTLWFRAMKEWSGYFQHQHYLRQVGDNGEDLGAIYTGQIPAAAEAAANFCLFLHSQYPMPEKRDTAANSTVNNYLIHSQVGILNTGEISNVKNISNSVGRLEERGQKDIATAINNILEAVAASTEIDLESKLIALDQLEELSKQAVLKQDERSKPGVLKAIFIGLGSTLGAVGSLAGIWDTWGPSISAFFQF